MNNYRPHLDWIVSQDRLMRQRVADWAIINSGTDNLPGLERMAAALRREFAALGEMTEVALPPTTTIDARGNPVPRPLGKALQLSGRPAAPLRVLLNIHMDTVYAADDPFQTLTPLDANRLRGPGVTDAKGGLAVLLTALQALEQSPWAARIGWEVLINPDEEIGSPGSANLLAQAAKRNHLGLLFEPAMGAGPDAALASHRRGSGLFTLVVHGRSAHAGRDFEQGRSAVVALAVLVVQMHALNNVVEGVTVNVGRIEGGAAVNVVPDLAIARVNVRTTELTDEKIIRGHLDDLVARANGKDGIRVQLHGGFTSPPKPLDDRMRALMQAVTACGSELGLRLKWKLSGGVSDGNKLAAAGLPSVDSLGPRGDRIHSAEEFIQLDSLVERAQLSALLLMKLASGELPWPPAV